MPPRGLLFLVSSERALLWGTIKTLKKQFSTNQLLNKELDNFVRKQVSQKHEVALGLRKSYARKQKSTLGPWSK
jgi:uncharacterized protein (UPF0332 family)